MEIKITLTDEQVAELLSKLEKKKAISRVKSDKTDQPFLSIKQTAQVLGVHESTIRKHIRAGLLEYQKFGGSYRISRKNLMDYAEKI